jgi:hypothetical protein
MDFVLIQNVNDEPVYAIQLEGATIFNPNFSECGRFVVNPKEHYGLDQKTVDALAMLNAHFGYSTEC